MLPPYQSAFELNKPTLLWCGLVNNSRNAKISKQILLFLSLRFFLKWNLANGGSEINKRETGAETKRARKLETGGAIQNSKTKVTKHENYRNCREPWRKLLGNAIFFKTM